jgi:Mrp family chromosome partitioning ATPase
MEHTFFPTRVRLEKRVTDKKSTSPEMPVVSAPAGPLGEPTARLHTIAFQPREMAALSEMDLRPADADADTASFRLHVGETPAEFVHLYAGLERIVNKIGDISMVTGNILDTERRYVLGVTSAVAGEGKTTTALHLAMTIARSTPKRVCLIDLSLGTQDLGSRLGMPAGDGQGLISAVEDGVDVVPCFNMTGCDNLMVVPSGRAPANPARFVRLPRLAQFLVASRHAFDVVVVDMPAVATEHAAPLCRYTDGVLMVVRAGVTPREVVADAIEAVSADRIHCLVLNRAKSSAPKWLQRRFGRA